MSPRTTALLTLAGLAAAAHAQPCDTDAIFTQAPVASGISSIFPEIEVVDLDGDGDLDLVVPRRIQGIEIWVNDGAGNFTVRSELMDDRRVNSIEVRDFDSDGVPDIAATRGFGTESVIEIIAGLGDGTFDPTPIVTISAAAPTHVAAADIDLDGDLDFIGRNDAGELLVYQNTGGLTFPTVVRFQATPSTHLLRVADLDGDGLPDVVSADRDGAMNILDNRGGGAFAPPRMIDLGGEALDFNLADLNGDGFPDTIRAANQPGMENGLIIRFNDGAGNFSATPTLYPTQALGGTAQLAYIMPGDVDGDGDIDAVGLTSAALGVPPLLIVYRNDGTGNFSDQSSGVSVASSFGSALTRALTDLDGDGAPDLIAAYGAFALGITRNACSVAPAITQQPASALVDAGGRANFSIALATQIPSTTFQWRRDGEPLADGAGIVGANTPDLTINSVRASDEAFYDCLVTSIGGERFSNKALLAVRGGGSDCPADFDGDGTLTLFDFLAFQNAFAAGCP